MNLKYIDRCRVCGESVPLCEYVKIDGEVICFKCFYLGLHKESEENETITPQHLEPGELEGENPQYVRETS